MTLGIPSISYSKPTQQYGLAKTCGFEKKYE
jgi:hypothetical protein